MQDLRLELVRPLAILFHAQDIVPILRSISNLIPCTSIVTYCHFRHTHKHLSCPLDRSLHWNSSRMITISTAVLMCALYRTAAIPHVDYYHVGIMCGESTTSM